MAGKNRGDARLGGGNAKLRQLAQNSEVAPARILPRQADDEVDYFLGQGRTAVVSMGIGPSSSYKGMVPAKDRRRRDEERRPPLTRDEASEGADDRSIGPGEAGTGGLAPEQGKLVAEHEDLASLATASIGWMRIAKDALDEPVEEGERHGWRASVDDG